LLFQNPPGSFALVVSPEDFAQRIQDDRVVNSFGA
jgi:hypothetical protein